MSELIINDDKGRVNDVVFGYVKLQSGAYKYQSKELEYTVDCIVDKTTAKAFKKEFPKNSYKEFDTNDFEGIYKIKPPFDAEEQFVIKLKANAQVKVDIDSAGLKAGDLVPYEWNTRPKAFVPVDNGVKDITMTTLISNGSKGDVSFRIMENSYGKFPQLTGILVTDLIEYIQEGSGSDFGNVVGGYNRGDGNPQQIPTENKEEETPEFNAQEEFNEDSIPF